MHIERGSINTILVNARPTLTPSRWLLWFRDPERNANVYCLCTALVGGSPTLIRFTETDTPTALSGEVKLSPPGNWELKVYEQTSTTNLNPANANRLVEAIDVLVVGEVEDETGWSGDPCPPCEGGGDCDPLTVTVNDAIEFTTVENPCGSSVNVPVVNEADEEVGTLTDGKIVVPTAKSLCQLVTEGTAEEVATCVTSSGKRPGVLAELIPTVAEPDTIAQVFDVMTAGQQALLDVTVQLRDSAGNNLGAADVYPATTSTTKTAPDGTVTIVDEVRDRTTIHAVRSGESKTITVSDWEGEFPAITPNTPTYVNEGDDTSGFTLTNGTLSTSSGIWRLTQTTGGSAGIANIPITFPVANKDWVLYLRARSQGTSGAQVMQIRGSGSERANIYFNFNSVTNSQQTGTLSIRGTNAAGVSSNAIVATGLSFNTDWQDMAFLFDSKNQAFALYRRQTDGSWLFGAHVNGTYFAASLEFQANSPGGGAWYEFDFAEIVSPNLQSIGDSLTRGSTLFSPIVASGLTDGTSTWQRWAPVYTSLRNNLIVNKGVGGNTIGAVEARLQADVLDNLPKLVFLSACANDYGAGTTLADKTTNTQDCIDLCATAGVPVILHNSTYTAAAFASNPAAKDYYKEWWDDYMPTLTGLQATVDTMGALRDPQGYADAALTQSDNVHPTPTGYRRMGQWIAALPYA